MLLRIEKACGDYCYQPKGGSDGGVTARRMAVEPMGVVLWWTLVEMAPRAVLLGLAVPRP